MALIQQISFFCPKCGHKAIRHDSEEAKYYSRTLSDYHGEYFCYYCNWQGTWDAKIEVRTYEMYADIVR